MARAPRTSELVYAPLGGAGEIGMNLYLYGHGAPGRRRWIIVDLGIGFPHEGLPGIDVMLPDTAFVEAEGGRLLGIVLTHAHEDHFGAVAELWPRLKAPVFATPFSAALLRARLEERGLEDDVPVTVLDLGARFTLGPFDIEYVTVTHSIPEPNALILRTDLGTVLHTGDWKIDAAPVIGKKTDVARLKALAEEGCDAMVCDSTNALREGASVSETAVAESLAKVIAQQKSRVVVASFSSNIARVLSLAKAGRAAGREIVIAGRALHRMIQVAEETGYMKGAGQLLDQDAFAELPLDKALAIVTGSQGEPRAALARIASGSHPSIALDEGDLVILSAKTIPGNEVAVGMIENRLAARGIRTIDADAELVHVTGHPRRDELKQMYGWVKPKLAIPMHGEMRHLVEHARLARDCGVPLALVVANGQMARIAPGPPEIIEEVPAGRVYRDGEVLVAEADRGLRERRRLANAGVVFVSLVVDRRGELEDDPIVEPVGLPERTLDGLAFETVVEDALGAAIKAVPRPVRSDPDGFAEAVRRSMRAAIEDVWGKKTEIRVIVTQI